MHATLLKDCKVLHLNPVQSLRTSFFACNMSIRYNGYSWKKCLCVQLVRRKRTVTGQMRERNTMQRGETEREKTELLIALLVACTVNII